MYSTIPRSLITSRASVLMKQAVRRGFSAKAPAPLEADSGKLATRVHHAMTVGLIVATPVYFLIPESSANGVVGTTFGLAWVTTVTAHSWIGLNYVCTDYVPKVSKALLGPSRYVNAAIAVITFLGMGKMCFAPGGIKGVLTALWKPKKKTDPLKDF
uniref:Succinate dehydrogenase [ubiquinone] cytochrome b small subunit n=1 Tax=Amphora coffeiformis TaxID=265554 RepID=A0A7S3PCE6_9STRA|mmetsp:Transcript_10225/g.19620  ORF Transcript_10225/g.19620 Transcript_10225/m.19620 type:complete len:157 (+) Transcript_10225:100-570(+)|eukprot:scaffold425_cov175-Amphora_coffeaeformis.AAC.20